MNLNDIQMSFNRSLKHTFSREKLFLVFLILAACGLLAVFFRGIATNAGDWVSLSLFFIPIFLCAGILLSTGIFLIRIYHDEIKGRPFSYKKILVKSWELIIGAAYFSIPVILLYLILWMLLGIFMMLKSIPGLGEFFGVVLAFAPFLINFLTLVLSVLNFAVLFYVTPVVALRGLSRHMVTQTLVRRWQSDVFSNLLLLFIALMPLTVVVALLVASAIITGSICVNCTDPVLTVIEWFFVMIPFTALLSPAVVFFFNFAAEAHVLSMREARAN